MCKAIKYWLILITATFLVNVLYATMPINYSDKIKIKSAYCINGEWVFNIYDGVENKNIKLAINKEKVGYKLEYFNQKNNLAYIKTPRGTFSISLKKSNSFCSPVLNSENETQQITKKTRTNTISRRDILSMINSKD